MIALSDLYFYRKIMHKYRKGKWNRFVFPLMIFYKNTGHTFLQRIKMDALFKFYLSNLRVFSSSSVKQVKFFSIIKNLVSHIERVAYPADILRGKATFLSSRTLIPANEKLLYLCALLRTELQKNSTKLNQLHFLDFANVTQLTGTGGIRMLSMPVPGVHDFEQKTNSTALKNTLIEKNMVVKTEKHYAPYNQERKSLIRFFRMREIIHSDVVFKKLKYKYLQKIGHVLSEISSINKYMFSETVSHSKSIDSNHLRDVWIKKSSSNNIFRKTMDLILRKPSMHAETVMENLHVKNQSGFHSESIDFNHFNEVRTEESSSGNIFRKPMDLILGKPSTNVETVIEDIRQKENNQPGFHSKNIDFKHINDAGTKKFSTNILWKPKDLILGKLWTQVETVIENVHKEKNQSVFHSKSIDFNYLNDGMTKKSSSHNIFSKSLDLILRKPSMHVETVVKDVKLHKEKIYSNAAGNLSTGIPPEKKLDEINVIADKVYKLFEKRLLIEKEKRGAHIIG